MAEVKLNLVQAIIYFGVLNTIVLSILLFFFSKNQKASRWLALLIFSVAFNLLDMEVSSYLYLNVDWYYLNRIPLEYSICFLYIYYVKCLLDPNFRVNGVYLWWLVPFLLAIVYQTGRLLYVSQAIPFTQKADYLYVQKEFLIMEGPAIFLALASYMLSYKNIRKYQFQIKRNFSNIEKTSLNWLRYLTMAAFSTGVIHLGYFVIEWIIYPDFLQFEPYFPFWVYVVSVLLTIGYKNLLQPDLSKELHRLVPEKKYSSSSLDENDMQLIGQSIKDLMVEEKLYRKNDLSLSELSRRLELSPHQVSQSLNQGLNSSFYDFINAYRVKEVKKRLVDPGDQHFTLLALALDAGFNSKNSFNKAFKKITNLSPSDYRKTMLKQKQIENP